MVLTLNVEEGLRVKKGDVLAELEKVALGQPAPVLASGGQEYLENLVNEFV